MVHKRQCLKRPAHCSYTCQALKFRRIVRQVMSRNGIASLFERIEPLFRRVVREELQSLIPAYIPPSPNPVANQIDGSSKARALQLQFLNRPPSTIFTLNRIRAEDGCPLQIALFDAMTQSIVKSSLKLELCVLGGEFGCNEEQNWREEEFKASIQHEREGRRPLLAGSVSVNLEDGVACIGNIQFTDNSSWIKCRKFRLGASVKIPSDGANMIREARSEPFVVKDHRGETNQKHFPPALYDEIWRLVKISKHGKFHRKLTEHGICTVKDFLRVYITQPIAFHKLFNGTPNKIKKAIVEHANSCVIDDNEFFSYHSAGDQINLLFNSIYKVVGVVCDGQKLYPHNLSDYQKHLVERVTQKAYNNMKELKRVDKALSINLATSSPRTQAEQQSFPQQQNMQQYKSPEAHLGSSLNYEDQQESTQIAFKPSSPNSSAHTQELIDGNCEAEFSFADTSVQGHAFTPNILEHMYERGECSSACYNEGNCWSPNVNSDTQIPIYFPSGATWPWEHPGNGYFCAPIDETPFDFGILPTCLASPSPPVSPGVHLLRAPTAKPGGGWSKIRAAIRWADMRDMM